LELAARFSERTRRELGAQIEDWANISRQLTAGEITEAEANRLYDEALQREIDRTDAERDL
jgi:hypothetical protein